MSSAGSVTPETFRAAMAELPSAVTAVTAWGPGGLPVGATVSAVTSLSLAPPMVLVCLAHTSDTLGVLQPGTPLVLHVLVDGQQELAARLAGKGPAKFDAINWQVGGHGLPELDGAALVAVCRVHDLVPGGDHVVVLADVCEVLRHRDDGPSPLVLHRRRLLVAASPT
jgi:flavin reductase (DIM6/NTAB) family NADH-FMN oxidoreductase RutF